MRFRLITAALLAATALSAPAYAQTAPTTDPTVIKKTKPVAKKPSDAAPAPAVAAAPAAKTKPAPTRAETGLTASPTDFGTVYAGSGTGTTPSGVNRQDIGGGYMIPEEADKTRSTVTRDAIAKQSPTANPYQLVNLLPGVNTAGPDATGFNGGTFTQRGFTSAQIGFTIEGAPVNDSGSYSIFPQEYVDAPNIEQVSLAQGTPDLDSPHIGATGGVFNIYMSDPSKTAGILTVQTFGSHNTQEYFTRVDSGQIDNFRGFISYSRAFRDHWSGVGTDSKSHIDGKFVWDLDAGNHVRFSAIYNEELNNNYVQPTLAQYNTPGFRPNFNPSLSGSASTDTNYVGYKINPFKNLILSAPSNFVINDSLSYDVTPYLWYGFGSGGGVSTLTENNGTGATNLFYGNLKLTNIDYNKDGTINNATKVNYYNPSITETYRPGVINKFTWDVGEHKFVAGYWFEFANHRQTAPYEALTAAGGVPDVFATNQEGLIIPNGPDAGQTLQRRNLLTQTMVNDIFVGDTWSMLDDKLKLDYGFKQVFVNRTVNNYLPGATPRISENDAGTLPQAGISYKITPENQVFASIGTTLRTTPNFSLADAFSTSSGAKTTIGTNTLAPERALTGEIGHRFQGDLINTSVSVFGTHYSNRQVTTNILDPNNPTITDSFNLNAGDAYQYGIDLEAGTRPFWGGLRPYASAEFLNSRINSNLATTGKNAAGVAVADFLPTLGKQLPQAPNFIGSLALDWDDGHVLANLSYKYTGKQFSTFTNDESIGGYGQVNAMIGYRFDDVKLSANAKDSIKAPEIRLNLYNLGNTYPLTGVNGVQPNAKQTIGINGSTIAASSAPTYYEGEGFAFLVSLTSKF